MYTRLWGLTRVGDWWFEWEDTTYDFEPFHFGTLEEAVKSSEYFRFTPTGDIVLTYMGDDELVDFLSANGHVVRDSEELEALRHVSFPVVEALGRDLESDEP